MCGIVAVAGGGVGRQEVLDAVGTLRHRGPDAEGFWESDSRQCVFGHSRLKVIDISDFGNQPMADSNCRFEIVLNGEIYNYLELREELKKYFRFETESDTEVLLAAFSKWGRNCLEKLVGMFAFAVWDGEEKTLFAARDRFGVKPLYFAQLPSGGIALASEIKALHALGVKKEIDEKTWASYFAFGLYGGGGRTFWKNINELKAGHWLVWSKRKLLIERWYDLADRIGRCSDSRPVGGVEKEYLCLLKESVKLRFRSDVPVGVNLSGGLDSSTLLGLAHTVCGAESDIKAFSFVTGDPSYDELPWIKQMRAGTNHELVVCKLTPEEVPELAKRIQKIQDEPFGGIPTLAYSKVFEKAREEKVVVLLDGNGMDEQWAGYDYYENALLGKDAAIVQGVSENPVRPECLLKSFRWLAEDTGFEKPFDDPVKNTQYRDIFYTKLPRALRFNDRISMMFSTELREPFLDHRLVELAVRQPVERKIRYGERKWLLRRIAKGLSPKSIACAVKRPVQTPQNEWLRGPLREWAEQCLERALNSPDRDWFDARAVRAAWKSFCNGKNNNSFFVWQWVNLGLIDQD